MDSSDDEGEREADTQDQNSHSQRAPFDFNKADQEGGHSEAYDGRLEGYWSDYDEGTQASQGTQGAGVEGGKDKAKEGGGMSQMSRSMDERLKAYYDSDEEDDTRKEKHRKGGKNRGTDDREGTSKSFKTDKKRKANHSSDSDSDTNEVATQQQQALHPSRHKSDKNSNNKHDKNDEHDKNNENDKNGKIVKKGKLQRKMAEMSDEEEELFGPGSGVKSSRSASRPSGDDDEIVGTKPEDKVVSTGRSRMILDSDED